MLKTYLQTLKLFSRNARLFLAVNTIISVTYVGIYVMLFNLYLLRLGYGADFIGTVNAVAQLGVVAFSLPAGMLGRRWGSRRAIIVGLSVATTGLALLPLAEFVPLQWQAAWLQVTYVLAWLGGASYMVNSLPFIMGVTDSAERVHVFSIREAISPIALIVGSLIGGLLPGLMAGYLDSNLADPAPYRYALFMAAALFSLAPIIMVATSEPTGETPAAAELQAAPFEKQAAPIALILFMAGVLLLQLAGKSVTDTFFNVYLDVNLQLTPAWMGILSAIAQLLVVPIALIAPMIIIRLGKRWTIILGTLGMAFSMLLLALFPHWSVAGLGFMSISALFAITTLAFTIASQELVSPEWRGTMSGALSMAMGLSRSTMAFGGGYLITTSGFASLFLVSGGLTIVGAILFWGYTWLPRHYILYRAGLKSA